MATCALEHQFYQSFPIVFTLIIFVSLWFKADCSELLLETGGVINTLNNQYNVKMNWQLLFTQPPSANVRGMVCE